MVADMVVEVATSRAATSRGTLAATPAMAVLPIGYRSEIFAKLGKLRPTGHRYSSA
jgi:hypothetical protein